MLNIISSGFYDRRSQICLLGVYLTILSISSTVVIFSFMFWQIELMAMSLLTSLYILVYHVGVCSYLWSNVLAYLFVCLKQIIFLAFSNYFLLKLLFFILFTFCFSCIRQTQRYKINGFLQPAHVHLVFKLAFFCCFDYRYH